MRIRVQHSIKYKASVPLRGALQLLRLTPRNFEGQHTAKWRIDVDVDCGLSSAEDAFGNIAHELSIDGPVSEFTVVVEGEVETFETAGIVRGSRENFPPELFLRSTDLTHVDEAISRFASDAAHVADDRLSQLHSLLTACHGEMQLDPASSGFSAAHVLKEKRGDSAGLAHLFIACARCLGVPARSVSGYVLIDELSNAATHHVWAEAYIAGLGWIGFDASRGLCTSEHYVRIACALDETGARPMTAIAAGLDSDVRIDLRMVDTQKQPLPSGLKTAQDLGTEEMTYCCGILVRDGLVMVADTRTNAGIDNISTFRKLHKFVTPDHHVMMIASAGSLSATQSILHLVSEGFENPETKEIERLIDCKTMFDAAQLFGRAIRRIRHLERGAYEQANLAFEVSFLLGGQTRQDKMRLFLIYSAGNFIECSQDAPFFQIGEYKYGKPVLDRAVSFETSLDDALKVALVSMDSTMRSNLGVGLPIDIATCKRDCLDLEVDERIDHTEAYFHDLRDRWSMALRQAHASIPAPPYTKRRT